MIYLDPYCLEPYCTCFDCRQGRHILDELHIMEPKIEVKLKLINCRSGDGYMILDTTEKGRVLFLHTEDTGSFQGFSSSEIQDIFIHNGCNCIVTCYPQLHYLLEPEEAELFNIQYPDVCKETHYHMKYDTGCPVMVLFTE